MSRRAKRDGSDYTVGYGKPPAHTRFRKGQSGNPRGRPRGSKSMASLLEDVLRQQISVTEQGQMRRISKREGVLTALVAKALRGDVKAIVALVGLTDAAADPETKDPLKALLERIAKRGKKITDRD